MSAEFLTRSQLAKRWEVTKDTIRRWEREGVMSFVLLGRSPRYSLQEILRVEQSATFRQGSASK